MYVLALSYIYLQQYVPALFVQLMVLMCESFIAKFQIENSMFVHIRIPSLDQNTKNYRNLFWYNIRTYTAEGHR